jgi:uncharacterized membrane protein YccC
MATAAAVTFVFNLPHPNWAVWSSLTVIRPARTVSLRRSAERLAGAVIGCALGLGAVRALNDALAMLAVITVVVVVFMVAFEQYTLAVAVRSALAPLAAFALSGDALGAGEARFFLYSYWCDYRDYVYVDFEQPVGERCCQTPGEKDSSR